MLRIALVVACVVCLPARSIAQTEKVTISIAPAANQTVHYVVTEEFSIQGASEGGTKENQPPSPTPALAGKVTTAYTLVTAAQTESGHITSQLTYDDSTAELTFGDAPPQKETAKGIVGSTFTIVFGADGDVIDVTAPTRIRPPSTPSSGPSPRCVFPHAEHVRGRDGDAAASRAVPATLLPKGPVTIDGRMTMTLVSVTPDGPIAWRTANNRSSSPSPSTRRRRRGARTR
jgi:hypothetical protein